MYLALHVSVADTTLQILRLHTNGLCKRKWGDGSVEEIVSLDMYFS